MRFRPCSIMFCAALISAAPTATSADTSAADDTSGNNAQTTSTYSIGWHSIDPGISRLRNSCFLLSATAGQPVPGHGAGGSYVVTSGFWAAAPSSGLDEIFFNGFEECGP